MKPAWQHGFPSKFFSMHFDQQIMWLGSQRLHHVICDLPYPEPRDILELWVYQQVEQTLDPQMFVTVGYPPACMFDILWVPNCWHSNSNPRVFWYGCEMQSGWIIIGCPKFEVQSPCSLHTTMSWVYALPYLHYPAIFPLNTQRISRYPHCRPQCMAWSRINRNKELKHNKPHLVVQLESLAGMTMEITVSWDMTLKKL